MILFHLLLLFFFFFWGGGGAKPLWDHGLKRTVRRKNEESKRRNEQSEEKIEVIFQFSVCLF